MTTGENDFFCRNLKGDKMKLLNGYSKDQEKTLVEVRTDRYKRQFEKEKERDIELSILYKYIEDKINAIKQLFEKGNNEDIYIPAYIFLVSNTLDEAKSYRNDLIKVTDVEYNNAISFYKELCKDLSEIIEEIEREAIKDSFQYADSSLDELIDGMAMNAQEYNRQQTIEKIKGSGTQLGAFDQVRKKKGTEDD